MYRQTDRQTGRQTETRDLLFRTLEVIKRRENMKVTIRRMQPIVICINLRQSKKNFRIEMHVNVFLKLAEITQLFST